MRDIYFRGKREDNGKWVRDSETYIRDGDGIWLNDFSEEAGNEVVRVERETLGQYTGFRDEYGNIYAKIGDEIMFCSNHKRGQLTEDKAEPSYPVRDIEISY